MDKFLTHNKFFLSLFLLVLVSLPVGAAPKIVNVDFVGLVKTTETIVRRHVQSIEGTTYSSRQVKRDIKSLYQTGLFADVYAKKKRVSGGLKLSFYVAEKGVIKGISFRGNKKLKDKALLDSVTIREHNLVDQKRIAESKLAIRKLYEDKGFYLVDIKTELIPYDTENNEYELIFKISENKQVRIKRINFIGNKKYSDRKLAKAIRTKVKTFFSFVSSAGKYQDEKLEQDLHLLRHFYQSRGHINVFIGRPQLSLTRNKKSLYITIPVYEGPQFKVSDVRVAGDVITTRAEILSKLKVKRGDVFNIDFQRQDYEVIKALYGRQAYAFATIMPDVEADIATKTAVVTYHVQKGKKIYIDRIKIVGNKITRDKVIRRELLVKENSPFNTHAVDLSRRRLMKLGYFEDVNFSNPGSGDGRVNLVVKVTEKPTGTFSIGAGFSSLENFVFTSSIQKDNFFGRGIRGSLTLNISKLRQEFSVSALDRYFLDTRWIFSTSIHRFTSQLNQDFDQKSFGGGVSLGRELFPFFDLSLGYSIDDVEINNFSSQVPEFFRDNASGLTSAANVRLTYDTRDSPLTTSKGMLHSVLTEYAGSAFGGNNNYFKFVAESRFFFSPLWKTVIKLRGNFSYINSLESQPTPLFDRFFLGGVNTLRGFDFQTIGPNLRVPRTPTGSDETFTYGGNRMVFFNTEYEVPIYDPAGLRFVLFFDAGQAFAENESFHVNKLRANYGFGLRWLSPFGPLRFEWGFPINKKADESSTVFNFTIGQAF